MCKDLVMNDSLILKYPNLLFLMIVALVFMLSNAVSERVFSLQNHIKGDRSTRMTTTTLD